MDDNQQSNTVKVLVDVLSASLQNLSDKINSINPVLNNVNINLDKELSEINKILFDTQSISKILDVSIGDFYKRFDLIQENIKLIQIKLENVSDIDNIIEKYKKDIEEDYKNLIKSLETINASILELKNDTRPVSKLSEWLTKPIGLIIFCISLILASVAVVNGFNTIVQYLSPQTTTKN